MRMGSQMTILTGESETLQFAKEFANTIACGSILLLEGDLGAGKTCFVRGLCEGLGGNPSQVSSPTFVIMQEYAIQKGNRLVHIDAYRLSGPEELATIGWDELIEDPDTIIAIEWPSKILSAIPKSAISLELLHNSVHSRELIQK